MMREKMPWVQETRSKEIAVGDEGDGDNKVAAVVVDTEAFAGAFVVEAS
jgi:hypothetical protein